MEKNLRIGLFLNYLDEEYQIAVHRGIQTEAEKLGLDLLCVQGETLFPTPFPSQSLIACDGILLLSSSIIDLGAAPPPPDPGSIFTVPVVSIGTRLFDCPSIIIRTRKSMEQMMEHLVGFHGYRKLLYIGGPADHQDNIVREHVFRRFINARVSQGAGLTGTVLNGEFHRTSGMSIVRDYIAGHPDNPPDVIVAANDNMALGAQVLLQTQRDPRWRNCPVTGFDDITQASLSIPALTTIRQPLDELGRLALRTLVDIITQKSSPQGQEAKGQEAQGQGAPVLHVESELRIRNSCGCTGHWGEDGEARGERREPDLGMVTSEYHLQNMSLMGQRLAAVNSLDEVLSNLHYFLMNINVKTFYLMHYGKPQLRIPAEGTLIYQQSAAASSSALSFRPVNQAPLDLKRFFADTIREDRNGPRSWCLYHLRSGNEYLGFILYEAGDRVYPQICSAAIFLANTIKRLQIHDDETERAQRLEQEVAYRTRDLVEINRQLQEEAKRRIEVEAEVLRISEMERLRFSMDLHDDICQRLAGISMFCKSLIGNLSPQTFLPELSELIDETLLRTRRYAHDSFPMELDTLGLKEALDSLCHTMTKQTPCRCVYSWTVPGASPLSTAQDINIYRIVQEALQNAVKHSGATRIYVDIRPEADALVVSVRDNGKGTLVPGTLVPGTNVPGTEVSGVIPAKKRGGLGLRSMRYRAHQLGAEYTFESGEQGGTKVEVRIPLT